MNSLHSLGLGTLRRPSVITHLPRPTAVVAPAPRATRQVSGAESAHVTRLLGALLNIEASAQFLGATPDFSGLLRDEINQLCRIGKRINDRMLKEFTAEDAGVITTINQCGNLISRLTILLCYCPTAVAEDAANAAGDVVARWHTPPKKRPARRTKSIQPAN